MRKAREFWEQKTNSCKRFINCPTTAVCTAKIALKKKKKGEKGLEGEVCGRR